MDGSALILCEGAFRSENGKTAHGLVRHTTRYTIAGVLDSTLAGGWAHEHCLGAQPDIPIVGAVEGVTADWLVVGVATQGGRLPAAFRPFVATALRRGMSVASGLHEFLGDDHEFAALAAQHGGTIVDVRRPTGAPNFFTGKIAEVDSLVVAVLGTEACVGKRTTTVLLAQAANAAGLRTAWVGTGQTAWLQGAQYSLPLDALVNDFVAGEIEHAVHTAWTTERPDVILVEGQGCLTHPAYPGGFEVLAAARPDAVVLQHAPGRLEYHGFPGYAVALPAVHVEIISLISRARLLAVTINPEGLDAAALAAERRELERSLAVPTCDPLRDGCDVLVDALRAACAVRRAG